MKRYIVVYVIDGVSHQNAFAFAEDARLNAQQVANRDGVESVELYRTEYITSYK